MMVPSFAGSLDALSTWRSLLVDRVDELAQYLARHELVEPPMAAQLELLRTRLHNDKLVVAFVAEFSRGKSELINAIFFAASGRRVMPASPGRTTMCPVELAWEPSLGPRLSLLPIETRLEDVSLAELRSQERAWRHMVLHLDQPDQLVQTMQEVTRTEWMPRERARELGFWSDEHPDDNPPQDDHGRVQVPAWRHALINHPHPLLERGLIVLDTPGLNAIGAEPELTLSLLPSAHATVFLLAADTGVTKSDLAIWREQVNAQAQTRYVVLNKIDTLRDTMLHPEQVQAQIGAQRRDAARILDVPVERVFPLSARQALAARVAGDEQSLVESRLPELEAELGEQLLPQRRAVIEQIVVEAAQQLEFQVARRMGDSRRQMAEQLLELRGLRGKSSAKLALMIKRVDAETEEFEQCTSRLMAMRAVHSRILKDILVGLSTSRLHEEVTRMEAGLSGSFLNLGARKAFLALCERLRGLLVAAGERSVEAREMLAVSFSKLNAEFGFGLALAPGPDLARFERELALIERNYVQYLGPTQALRLSSPRFIAQFKRMLVSRLRMVFENASSEVELWNKAASAQVDGQLRERRQGFRHRRDSLERVEIAASELEQRIDELEAQDERSRLVMTRVSELTEALRTQAAASPPASLADLPVLDLEIELDIPDAAPQRRHA